MLLLVLNISNLQQARFFQAYDNVLLGFNLDALAQDAVSLTTAKEIVQWLYEPTIILQAASHQSEDELNFLAQEIGAAYILTSNVGLDLDKINLPVFFHQNKDEKFFKHPRVEAYLVHNSHIRQINNENVLDFYNSKSLFFDVEERVHISIPHHGYFSIINNSNFEETAIDFFVQLLEEMSNQ